MRAKEIRSKLRHRADGNGHRRMGTASARVYDHLRRQIMDGELAPGSRLSHRAIAEAMNTSNGPVITALRRLAHDGLIAYEPGQGGTVSEFSDEQLQDLLIVRRALETEAARLAARRASPEDVERLYTIVDRMAGIVQHQLWTQADALDVELHVAIARLSRSSSLKQALERCHLLDLVRRRLVASEKRQDFEKLERNHRALVDAIASGDPDRAGRSMHAHLSRPLRIDASPVSRKSANHT